jgi:hypothetical protein
MPENIWEKPNLQKKDKIRLREKYLSPKDWNDEKIGIKIALEWIIFWLITEVNFENFFDATILS